MLLAMAISNSEGSGMWRNEDPAKCDTWGHTAILLFTTYFRIREW
jgi:hypothetical protein